jgi:hypothetical protein
MTETNTIETEKIVIHLLQECPKCFVTHSLASVEFVFESGRKVLFDINFPEQLTVNHETHEIIFLSISSDFGHLFSETAHKIGLPTLCENDYDMVIEITLTMTSDLPDYEPIVITLGGMGQFTICETLEKTWIKKEKMVRYL